MKEVINTKKFTYDYNPTGNRNDRVCRALLAKELLNEKTIHVIDVANDKFFQKKDIDIICINKELKSTTVEIKATNSGNAYGTKTVFLETISNSNKYLTSNSKEGRGCILITESDFLIFYFIRSDTYMIVKTKALQNYVQKHISSGKYPVKSTSTYGYNGMPLYDSYGLIVPVQDLITEAGARIVTSKYKYDDIAKEVA